MNIHAIMLLVFGLWAAPLYASTYPGQKKEDLEVTADEIARAVELRRWFENGGYKKHVENKDKSITFKNSKRTYAILRARSFPVDQPSGCREKKSNCAHEEVDIVLQENGDNNTVWGCLGNIGILRSNQNTTTCRPLLCLPFDQWYQNSKVRQHSGSTTLYEKTEGKGNVRYCMHGRQSKDRMDKYASITHPLLRPFFMQKNSYRVFFYQKLFNHSHAAPLNTPRVVKGSWHVEEKPEETRIVAHLAPIAVCAAFALRLSSLWQK
jgi:hypothetical protein